MKAQYKKEGMDLTKGSILQILMTLALPLIVSSLLQYTYNLMDMFFVGQLGSGAIASVGTASFVFSLGYAAQAVVVIGTGIKVSHALGERSSESVNEYIATGLRLNMYIGIVYILIACLCGKGMISFFKLKDGIIEKNALIYLIIGAPMMFFAFYNLLYTRILGSFGNNYTALKVNSVGVLLNMILDPLLIYKFKMGVGGAALASLIGNIVVFLLFYYKTQQLFKIHWVGKIDKVRLKEIINLGLPMAGQRILFTFINILLARQIASFGANAIAAQKIGFQIESVSIMVLAGLNNATASFIGQNFGAKNFKRIKEGYRKSIIIGVLYTIPITILFLISPEALSGFFVSDYKTIIIASNYLRYIGVTLAFAGIEMVSNGAFSGIGLPKIPATISIIFTISRIPLAVIFTRYMGINGVWFTIALTSFLKGIIAFFAFKFKVGKDYSYA